MKQFIHWERKKKFHGYEYFLKDFVQGETNRITFYNLLFHDHFTLPNTRVQVSSFNCVTTWKRQFWDINLIILATHLVTSEWESLRKVNSKPLQKVLKWDPFRLRSWWNLDFCLGDKRYLEVGLLPVSVWISEAQRSRVQYLLYQGLSVSLKLIIFQQNNTQSFIRHQLHTFR